MDAAASFACVFGQPFQIEAVVLASKEADLAAIAVLNQVEGNARQGETRTARHGRDRWREEKEASRKPWSVPYYAIMLVLCMFLSMGTESS